MAQAAQLSEPEWKRLVCAMFTNARLVNNGHLLVDGEIKKILNKYDPKLISPPGAQFHYYSPYMTALYQENSIGDIMGEVLASDTQEHQGTRNHSEQQLIQKDTGHLLTVRSIGMSFSPCTACARAIVDKYKEKNLTEHKPVIHFSQVYKRESKDIELLIENGFNLKVWETIKILHYLLKNAPNNELRGELQQAYRKNIVALFQRDMKTQELIEKAREEVLKKPQTAKGQAVTREGVLALTKKFGATRLTDDDDDNP